MRLSVGETKTKFLVFVQWEEGSGGVTECSTLAEAEALIKNYVDLGYDKPNCPVVIYKLTEKRIR